MPRVFRDYFDFSSRRSRSALFRISRRERHSCVNGGPRSETASTRTLSRHDDPFGVAASRASRAWAIWGCVRGLLPLGSSVEKCLLTWRVVRIEDGMRQRLLRKRIRDAVVSAPSAPPGGRNVMTEKAVLIFKYLTAAVKVDRSC
ncbi:hypothetical protein MRX96_013975 [Rhipicephalus microplus]